MEGSWSLFEPTAFLASAGIIFLSFVSEDAATLSSALLLFGGPIAWPLGFLSCFVGIWAGDLGLYSLARYLGKPVLQSRWVTRFADAATVQRCAETFSRNGSLTLLLSRFVPGTRLPTYLAAGLLSMPVGRFAGITGLAALVWITLIFALTKLLGSHALAWFNFLQSKVAAVVLTGFLLLGTALFLRKALVPLWTRAAKLGQRLSRWEFWPAWLFYLPVGLAYLWLALRYRSLSLPTAANPGMPTGGFVGESKFDILQQLQDCHPEFVAEAFLLDGLTTTDRLLSLHHLCREHRIKLPFILKPDVGQRGDGVRLIRSLREALDYLLLVDAPVVLQRYASGQHEAGVFYFRFPGETRGQIFSITEKIFPTITGDGARTIEELIRQDSRAGLIAHVYLERFADRRSEVLPNGAVLKLVETGNHAQGCIFRDGGRLWTESLESTIDRISRQMPGFHVGRYDIRFDREEDFRGGRNFQIVELNGASSEATSIYDARKSLRSAYRTLFRQWRLVFAIGAANRARGCALSSWQTLWQEWRHCSAAALTYPRAS